MIKYNDFHGTKDTILFSPVICVDGSDLFIEEAMVYVDGNTYVMPKTYIKSNKLFVDYKKNKYVDSELGMSPGSFKLLWTVEDTMNVLRYTEEATKVPVKDNVKEEPNKYKVPLFKRIIRWMVRRLNEIS